MYPTMVKNASGQTLVTNAGSNGKFLGVLDLDVRDKKVVGVHYKLLPVFQNCFDGFTSHIGQSRPRVGDGGLVHHMFTCNRLPR